MLEPGNLLDCLPNELLGSIRDCYEEHDLIGHTKFSQLTSRTASFYPEDFWETICRKNGLGRLPGHESEVRGFDWCKVARECALHASTCTHPGCGRARLAENVDELAYVASVRPDHPCPLPDTDNYPAMPSTVFAHIGFRRVGTVDAPQCVGYLRPGDNSPPSLADSITEHPIALRTFATIPAIADMVILGLETLQIEIAGKCGITVAHILEPILKTLGEPLTHRDILELLDNTATDEVFPASWPTADRFRALGSLIDWFRLIQWHGFYFSQHEPQYNLKYYHWDFSATPNTLPARYIDMPRIDDVRDDFLDFMDADEDEEEDGEGVNNV